jgi:putative peptidoglycan lipid II flippase
MPEHRPVVSSAKLIAGCTLTSRVTGLIRDMLLVHTFGATWVLDAFLFAFQFPNLFRRLFGEGALAAVFVPKFTHMLETEGRPSAWQLLARTLALLSAAIIVVMLVIEGIVLAIWLLKPGVDQTILALTALMLPFMLTICVVALFSSILNCLGSFVPAALMPVVLNIVMIAGIVGLGPAIGGHDPQRQIFGVAISVLVAGVAQLALLRPVLRGHGVALGWSFQPRDPDVRQMLHNVLPVLFGQGVLLVSTFLDAAICAAFTHVEGRPVEATFFGFSFVYPLKEGALSAVTVAQRLYQFPLGVLGISLAVAALPTFSRLATHRDWPGWTHEVTRALRLALFAGLLTGGLMIVLAEPIVRLLFEYRKFDAEATARAARVLTFYGFGMWAFCVQHIVLRGFYSVGDVRTPVKISCVLVPINLAMSLVLIWLDGIREAAFAISTSLTSTLTVLVGMALLQRRTQTRLVGGALFWGALRMLVAAGVSAWAASAVRSWWQSGLTDLVGAGVGRRAIDTLGALALGCAVFLVLSWLLRLPEARLLLRYRRSVRAPGR